MIKIACSEENVLIVYSGCRGITLWRPRLPHGYTYKAFHARPG